MKTQDRWLLGVAAGFIADSRLHKIAIAIKPSTILKFHKALVKRKYKLLYSNNGGKKPGPHGPSPYMIDLVVEMKQKNPRFGYRRIAMQIYQSLGITISCFAVGRVLRQHHGLKLGGNKTIITQVEISISFQLDNLSRLVDGFSINHSGAFQK